jgi:chloride channel 3/4/5
MECFLHYLDTKFETTSSKQMEENASESCRLLPNKASNSTSNNKRINIPRQLSRPYSDLLTETRTSTQTRRKRQLYDNVGDVQNHGYRWRYDDYTTIDWSHDTIKDRIRHRKIRSSNTFHGFFYKHYDASQAWIVLIIVGLISGVLASLMDFSIPVLEDLKRGYCSRQFPIRQEWCCLGKTDDCWITWESIFGSEVAFGIYTILGVSMAMISCVLVINGPIHTLTSDENNHYLPEPISIIRLKNSKVVYDSAGSGIPEVKTILGGFVITGFLGFRTLATKIIGLIFAIASGLSIGVQGPLVHIACCVGNITTRIFQKYSMNEAKRREIMSAACAAGVSVAFGAPIGGVLFSLEEVSYYFPPKTMWRSFFCALIAAVTLKLIDPFGTGKLVRFQVTYDSDWNHWELLSFLFLGMIGGLYGALFTKVVMLIDRFKNMNNLNIYPMLEVCIVSLATSVLSFGNQFTWMSNVEFVTELLTECKGVILSKSLCQFDDIGELLWQLLFALAVNIFLMVITFGIKVPGGVFVPSMVVGACFGRIYGIALEYLINTGYLGDVGYKITPGVYALSGAAGVLGGVTRMTGI